MKATEQPGIRQDRPVARDFVKRCAVHRSLARVAREEGEGQVLRRGVGCGAVLLRQVGRSQSGVRRLMTLPALDTARMIKAAGPAGKHAASFIDGYEGLEEI